MGEELILGAGVKDNFSKPLRDLSDKLKNLRPSPALQATQKHFVELRKQVEQVGNAMKGMGQGLVGGLGLPGLSLGALSAAGAMAALGASVRSFATTTVDMKNFQAATGIAVTKLRELKAVAAGLGVSEDAIQNALGFSAQNADAMRRHRGNYSELANLGPGGVSIANDLAGTKTNDEVLEKQFRYLSQQKNAAQRRQLAQLFFGDEGMAAFGNESYASLMKRRGSARASVGGQSGQDEKNAEAFLDATSKVSAAFEKLKNSVGGALAPGMTEMAEAINKFSLAHTGDVKTFFTDLGDALKAHDWAADGHAINTGLQAVRSFFEELNKFKASADSVADAFHNADVAVTKWVEDHAKSLMPSNITPQTGAELGKKLEKATEGKDVSPDANRGLRDTMMDDGNVHKMSYSPGARAGAMGIVSASQSATVAILAAGVFKGMQDFYQSLQTGSPGADGSGGSGNGGGPIQAAYHPGAGGVRMGGGGSGGSMSYGSARAVTARGSLAKNQKLAYDAAIAEGLSPTAANALVANMSGESLANPSDHHWDVKHMSQGIVQWDPARAAAIQKKFGKLPKDMSVEDQTRAAIWEVKTKYPKTWKSLSGGGNAESMVDTLVRDFERPGNPGKAVSQRLGFLKGFQQRMQAAENDKKRESLSSKKAASDAAAAGAAAKGKVDIHVHSKDQPVTMKTDKSDLFGETKLNRGKSVGLMEI